MADEQKSEQRFERLEKRLKELEARLSQTDTLATSPQSAHGEYLLSKGWIPTENGLWELPAKPQQVSKVMVKIPNIKPGKPETEFERTVVQTMLLPCSTEQAVYQQRQMEKVA